MVKMVVETVSIFLKLGHYVLDILDVQMILTNE